MSAVKKLHPANDLHARASEPISVVVLPRRGWGPKYALAAIVACLVMAGGLIALTQTSPKPVAPAVVAAVPAKPVDKNFDITLNAVPPTQMAADPDPKPSPDLSPRVMDITADDDVVKQAAIQALSAPSMHDKKNDDQALRTQYRAVELAPDNILFRLQLAVMYDRAGKNEGALQLYRQVLTAYDQQDIDLPLSVNIDTVRKRAAYLAALKP